MAGDTLTPREVAEELGVTVRTVQRWIGDGRLPAQRVGGRMRVSRSSLPSVAPPGRSPAPQQHAIRTLLVANRGEIVGRVARTASRLGIRVVGISAPGDRPPPELAEWRPIESYLDATAILRAARDLGADAVHPGYGFLSESPGFAAAVIGAGLIWVGPTPEAMAALGDKAAARRLAIAQGVAVLPGYDAEAQDDVTLAAAAERIGYPVLLKPAAGGGGKGMRLVRDAADLPDALAAARREARRAFDDERLILERYLDGARHIEVQVLLDAHGGAVHLGERDCSAQRRSQKVVEEAPAPSVDAPLRERLGQAALSVTRAAGYRNAGTAEFLVDEGGAFYFIELNARLQVEHPVTEAVTGRDLVADQLLIASGQPLGIGQADVRFDGHAIEARVYAEDPEAGFLPSAGRLAHVHWPGGVRVDTHARAGDMVDERYDPMLAKLIAHGRNRDQALRRLRDALREASVLGVRSNLRFLRWLLDQPAMTRGEVRTDTLATLTLPALASPTEREWRAAASALLGGAHHVDADPWGGGWRLNSPPVVRLVSGDEQRTVAVTGQDHDVALAIAGDRAFVDVDGQSVEIRIAPAPSVEAAEHRAGATGGAAAAALTAPMPGRVIAVRAKPGEAVAAHATVVVLEAMKMEHAVTSPIDGRVARVTVAEGQQVQRGELLGSVEPETSQ